MKALTKLYWWSTDPDTKYIELLSPVVGASILLHASAYTIIVSLLIPRISSWMVLRSLCVIMALGYIMRLYRAKAFREVYLSKTTVKELMDKAYVVWYFLG